MGTAGNFAPFKSKMENEGLPDVVIRTFGYYYDRLVAGEQGLLSKKEIAPVDGIPVFTELADHSDGGVKALDKTCVIKLNGGLGTSMGMNRAKSLLPVKDDLAFLDVIALQNLYFRETYGCRLPLIFMNSFSTRDDTLAYLEKYPQLGGGIPLDFMQHKVPKVTADGFAPAEWPADPSKEWCPPGHGDIYTAMVTSGILDLLLAEGIEYAFVSNGDNLGAVLDPGILGYFAKNGFPYMTEVTTRTPADKKGGHLAQYHDGTLVLRDTAQCPPEELPEFEDVYTYKYFHCNNLWINLSALKALLDEKDGILGLALIRNGKTVDPRDSSSPKVYQLETAMGTVVSVFKGAQALQVPRNRFAPVKKCGDLLGLWSDAFSLTDSFQLVKNPARGDRPPVAVLLDDRYYKLIDRMQERFPQGAPSLVECGQFTVRGDVSFGQDITVKGDVTVTAENGPAEVDDGIVLEGEVKI